jgi:hypothetical protein
VVHARLVLLHLPGRETALKRMIASLKPGGWLLIEDFDVTWLPFKPSGDAASAALFHKVLGAFAHVLAQGGVDIAHGRSFYPKLREADLINVNVDIQSRVWPGGSPDCDMHHANISQLRDKFISQGLLTDEEIQRFYALLDDPDFSVNGYPLVSGRGQRPG